jgi:HAE1 family hydrophobic/amphiphilic exporter-1
VLPIALGLGAGAESRKPLGVAGVGGLLFSMLLTLVMVPVVYTLLARFSRVRKVVEEPETAGPAPIGVTPEPGR